MKTIYFGVYDEKGEIVSTGDYIDGLVDDPIGHLGGRVVTSDTPVVLGVHYVHDGVIESFPDKPSPSSEWDWSVLAWQFDMTKAKSKRSADVSNACRTTIISGFESSALGAAYHYPTKMTDQQNLASSILDSLLPDLPDGWTTPFWCADVAGEWAFRPHTAMQIQQVGRDAKQAILAAMARNEQLQAQITAATTLEELEAISW